VIAAVGVLAALSIAAAQAGTGGRASAVKVAFVSDDIADPFFDTMHCGAKKAAAEQNVHLTWQGDPSFDIPKEVSIFNAVVITKPDAIIVVPFNAQAFVQPVKQAKKNGIVVIANNAPVAGNIPHRTYLTDEFGLGKVAGVGLAKQVGGKGEVALLMPETGLFTFDNRGGGFKAAIAKYPGMKLVATEFTGGDAGKASAKTAAILQAHPNLVGMFAVDTTDGEGAGAALLAAGKRGKVKLVAYDASPKEVFGLKRGLYQGLVAQDPYTYGYKSVTFAAKFVRKQVPQGNPQKPVVLGGAFIDKSNVDSPTIKKFLYRQGGC
jgi:ribose transport system substrate-binding protein